MEIEPKIIDAKELSIEALSNKSGLSKSYISKLENGKRKPSMEAIEKISETLGIPVVVLLMLAAEKGEISTLSPDLVSELQKSVLDVLGS
ncbi:unnamed protein product [Commensalibacter communis]|uniref:helix-turn-helix domain-containing protein n=1 Tax=Commensalibacter communis TaxID=2972786 RepID=UPI0022FF5F5D|nr:helix-turn-helix transcriptional regulator [Commensalibacter communis]CAI3953476.1 unnamed protein product [Commensalibacter communis]CAI3959291.1 unnamed protein product [Commensalibacter communis]